MDQLEEEKKGKSFYHNWLNQYTIPVALFLVWICFISDNSGLEIFKLKKEIRRLQEECDYYEKKIEQDKKSKEELFSNSANLEKFAREKYYMKRNNEDIYIIVK